MGLFQDLFGRRKTVLEENKAEQMIEENIEGNSKRVIKSIDELKKINVEETPVEEKKKEKPVITTNPSYKLPPLALLNRPKVSEKDNKEIEDIISKIELCLKSFKINSKVIEVQSGPLMTRYELEVSSGTDLNKMSRLNKEIAMTLSKKEVIIETPIPGKNTVGITIDNDIPTTVSFYEMMTSKVMEETKEKKLIVPLGKTPIGEPCTCEINKMPHLLISGTTGSGKTVLLNNIICSIIMKSKPDEVKLVLVDTKVVEFNCYNGIPHLLCPVISNPKQVAILLQKMVYEIEKRYHMFASTSTKKIEGYNEYVEKWNKDHQDEQLEKMPYILIIVDDLLDLMAVAQREIEDSIIRITQKARSAGIHLIISTQRPSREVLTDIIKTNIPSRVSFAVSSRSDSNTILDQEGAENLSGNGDMLYLPTEMKNPLYIQGSYIEDNEIQKIIDYVKTQQEAFYDDSLIEQEKEEIDDSEGYSNEWESLYDEIIDFVIKQQKASASLLQRRFKIDYNRAATMIDKLEADGIIGPPTGTSEPREVLVRYSDEDY